MGAVKNRFCKNEMPFPHGGVISLTRTKECDDGVYFDGL